MLSVYTLTINENASLISCTNILISITNYCHNKCLNVELDDIESLNFCSNVCNKANTKTGLGKVGKPTVIIYLLLSIKSYLWRPPFTLLEELHIKTHINIKRQDK